MQSNVPFNFEFRMKWSRPFSFIISLQTSTKTTVDTPNLSIPPNYPEPLFQQAQLTVAIALHSLPMVESLTILVDLSPILSSMILSVTRSFSVLLSQNPTRWTASPALPGIATKTYTAPRNTNGQTLQFHQTGGKSTETSTLMTGTQRSRRTRRYMSGCDWQVCQRSASWHSEMTILRWPRVSTNSTLQTVRSDAPYEGTPEVSILTLSQCSLSTNMAAQNPSLLPHVQ